MATVSKALGGSPTTTILTRIESATKASDYDIPKLVGGNRLVKKTCVSQAETVDVNARLASAWVGLVASSPDREKPAPQNLTLPKVEKKVAPKIEPETRLGIEGLRRQAIALMTEINPPTRISVFREVKKRSGVSISYVRSLCSETAIIHCKASACLKVVEAMQAIRDEQVASKPPIVLAPPAEVPDGTAQILRLLKRPEYAKPEALVAEIAKRSNLTPAFVEAVIIDGEGAFQLDDLLEDRLIEAATAIESEPSSLNLRQQLDKDIFIMLSLGFKSKAAIARALGKTDDCSYAVNTIALVLSSNDHSRSRMLGASQTIANLLRTYVVNHPSNSRTHQKQA